MDYIWANVFLCFGLFACVCAVLGRFRMPYKSYYSFPVFMVSWLTSELAWCHFLFQAFICVLLVISDSLSYWQGIVALILLGCSMALLRDMHSKSQQAEATFDKIFHAQFGEKYIEQIAPGRKKWLASRHHPRFWLRPFTMKNKQVTKVSNISYGDDPRHRLDIYYDPDLPSKAQTNGLPVLFYIHGGGWIVGNKSQQALPLIYHLAARGWVVVSINYRLGPRHRFPAPLVDAKQALVWTKDNIAQYGGDPDFIVSSGGSAGGHLALMLALTDNPTWQPGFEQADTRVAASVPLYAVYDFMNKQGFRPDNTFERFLSRYVMPNAQIKDPQLWQDLSPLGLIHENAPPMLIIHGSHDALVPIEEAREFAKRMKASGKNKTVFVELEAAQHAFEIFHSVRTEFTVDAIQIYLEIVYHEYRKARGIS